MIQPSHRLCALGIAILLSGCASVSPDGLRSDVQALTNIRTAGIAAQLPPTDPAAQAQAQQAIQAWLAQPLSQEAAVRIALLNNPGLQARMAALGIADAQRVQAITLPNPHLSIGRLTNSHEREIERSIAFNLLSLITLPWRMEQSQQQIEVATLQAAQDVVALAAQARRAWIKAVAAEQVAAAHERMHEAAEAGAELARRMVLAGNWSRLQQAREQTLLADSSMQLTRARLAAALEREQLHRVLGLWGQQTHYTLEQQLPPLPATPLPSDGIEAQALQQRLDVQAARRQWALLARQEGWATASAILSDVGLTYQRNTSTERDGGHSEVTRGWELELPLPLFDWGGAARAQASAAVRQQAALLQETAVKARSEVRSAWLTYRTAFDLAHYHAKELVPLQQRISDETTLRYNGMLLSVWDMLAQARTSVQAVANAVQAQRDFWLAETDLQLSLTGTSPGSLQTLGAGSAGPANPDKGH
jgi:outer membrane protein TolC